MAKLEFIHLRCHSTYSLLQALPSPAEVVARAKELGQSAVGLCDKGYTYGLTEFTLECGKAGIKPILGIEVGLIINDQPTPITLLAETQEGYANLLRLATACAVDGSSSPTTTRDLLRSYGKGLLLLSGPLAGAIPQAALAEDGRRIEELTEEFRGIVGDGSVYFELMDLPHLPGQSEANQQLISWGKKLSVPVVATCPAHYCRPEDAEAHDVLLCIQRNALVSDPGRFSMREHDYSMRAPEEILAAFAHVPEAVINTRAIADRCTVSLKRDGYEIPRFPVGAGNTEKEELRKQCEVGFRERYPKATKPQRARLEHELQIIADMGFSGYFLIVADFINEARRRGITVGPGRGSAAGSIVSYSLGITALDPLEHGLLFERFLNPERVTMPDIDTDFADDRRDEVLEYVRQKYGADHVVQICTFGTLAARAAVKDVGRAYGMSFLEMNALAKLIPDRPGTKLADALQTDELKAAYEGNETYRKIIESALKLEGKARHVSVHACGVVITEEPTVAYTALQRAPKDDKIIITQTPAKPLEALGLLKMDFLGLTNLTVIQTTLVIIERTTGGKIDISQIPLDDAETYALLRRGETTGVFQFESPGMRRYLKQLKPTRFADITAMAALYRPGPMEWIPSFIKRKNGQEKVTYLHPDLQEIFTETYGIGVYQEQILQLARVFSGYSLGEADLLRRAIGKKIKKELDAQREKFIDGGVKKGNERKVAERIFEDVILPFAGYGFPKAHAAGYARIAYETAYLKAHYPTEFMAALLSSDSQKTDRVMIEIEECRAMGIAVLPPDINESLMHFTAIPGKTTKNGTGKGSIRFGLSAIKGVGDSSVEQIITARGQETFRSIDDFACRVPARLLNKKLLESLAKSGALDSLGERRMILDNYDRIADFAKASDGASLGQTDLFSQIGDIGKAVIDFPATPPATPLEKLRWEKETLGMYVSSHPLAGLRKYIGKKAQLIGDLTTKDVGKAVTLAGIEEGMKKLTTKRGESMAILSIEDPTGKIEVTLFPRVFQEAVKHLGQPDTVLVIGGTLDFRAGQLQLKADAIKRAALSTIIARAKEEGFFDEAEAASGISIARREFSEAETVDLVDEEGNVIAGETVVLNNSEKEDDPLGPLARWLSDGADMQGPMEAVGLVAPMPASPSSESEKKASSKAKQETKTVSPGISVHTIRLPERAPKQLLLDLRQVLQTFPGKERIQLKIGEQAIPLPFTVSMSTVLEKRIDDVLGKYSEETAGAVMREEVGA